jgi:anti-sigma B factor antagonist
MADFALSHRHAGGSIVFDLQGDLDGRATERMRAAQAALVEGTPSAIVLDFAELGYMNSTGIALIVGVLAEARRLGTEVQVRGLSDHYRHIFEITRLADFVTFVDAAVAVDENRTPTS